MTGYSVTHTIIEGGPYALAFNELAATGWKLTLESADKESAGGTGKKADKATYTCAQCGLKMWGKPKALIDCHDCGLLMVEQAP